MILFEKRFINIACSFLHPISVNLTFLSLSLSILHGFPEIFYIALAKFFLIKKHVPIAVHWPLPYISHIH